MRQKKIAILISGGLDSSILLATLCGHYDEIYPIYVKSGNYWETVEEYWLKKFLKSIRCASLKKLRALNLPAQDLNRDSWAVSGKKVPGARSKDEAVYLPGRNILLIAKTAIFCAQHKIKEIALAPLKTNPFPDAKPLFFNQYARVLSQALSCPIRIKTPFITKTKNDILFLGSRLRLDLTFSCIHPEEKRHCGKCNKCAERKAAFRTARMTDPTRYAN